MSLNGTDVTHTPEQHFQTAKDACSMTAANRYRGVTEINC